MCNVIQGAAVVTRLADSRSEGASGDQRHPDIGKTHFFGAAVDQISLAAVLNPVTPQNLTVNFAVGSDRSP
jgi:hypothetical protein